MGWIGVDLDGTLAVYDGWKGAHHIGEPIPKMIERVRRWYSEIQIYGRTDHGATEIRIFTARVGEQGRSGLTKEEVVSDIQAWCFKHLGFILPVTNVKDFKMIELWDDRAIQVEKNTGRRIDGRD